MQDSEIRQDGKGDPVPNALPADARNALDGLIHRQLALDGGCIQIGHVEIRVRFEDGGSRLGISVVPFALDPPYPLWKVEAVPPMEGVVSRSQPYLALRGDFVAKLALNRMDLAAVAVDLKADFSAASVLVASVSYTPLYPRRRPIDKFAGRILAWGAVSED